MKNVLYARDYHEPGVREITFLLKKGEKRALHIASLEMAGFIKNGYILIPVPGHLGYPTYTKKLAEMLGEITKCVVKDIIRGNERPSWCFLKKRGILLTEEEFGFQVMEGIYTEKILLIDNVYATGATYRAIKRVLPTAKILVYSIDKTQNNER